MFDNIDIPLYNLLDFFHYIEMLAEYRYKLSHLVIICPARFVCLLVWKRACIVLQNGFELEYHVCLAVCTLEYEYSGQKAEEIAKQVLPEF